MKTLIALLVCLMVPVAAEALQATATWSLPADPSRTGGRVERRDGPDTSPWVLAAPVLPADRATFNQAGLALGERYCYRVITVGDFGSAAPLGPACGTPDAPLPASGPVGHLRSVR